LNGPRRLQVDPPRVRKAGWVLLDETRTWATFAGLSVTLRYGSEAEARCSRERCPVSENHAAPHPAGTCGFHGTDTDPLAWMVPEGAVLDVELYGRVIRHERGWRASHQRVLGVAFARGCMECRREVPDPVLATVRAPMVGRQLLVVPRCGRCAAVWRGRDDDPIAVADLAGLLGTEVSWAGPQVTARALRQGGRRSRWYGKLAG
jgi:hypothetical protein